MNEFNELYDDYKAVDTASLKAAVRAKFANKLALGCGEFMSTLEKAIKITNRELKDNAVEPQKKRYLRKSGEPYINHALRVALILIEERLYNRPEVVIAAVLHDIFDYTYYTREQACEDFGIDVANLVSCVAEVTADQNEKFAKASDEKDIWDYNGIIDKCRTNTYGLYIKFADRLDNLRTVDALPRAKQIKKIKETKEYLLPLMSQLSARLFFDYVSEAVFIAEQRLYADYDGDAYLTLRNKFAFSGYVESARKTSENLKSLCNGAWSDVFDDVIFEEPRYYEIFSQLSEADVEMSEMTQSSFVYRLSFIKRDENDTLPDYRGALLRELLTNEALSNVSVTRVEKDAVYVADSYGNRFEVNAYTYSDYNMRTYGIIGNGMPIMDESVIPDDPVSETIVVKTMDMEEKTLIAGATVIDFAYLIHEGKAACLSTSLINGRYAGIYTVLSAGDKVRLIWDETEHISLDWLEHCATRKAKSRIKRYYSNLIKSLQNTITELKKSKG